MHYAAASGNFGFLGPLLEHRADPNAQNLLQATPLHLACRGTGTFVIQDLLDASANPRSVDAKGNTPLHFAASAGNAEICKLLLKRGAEVNAQNRSGFTPLYNATRCGHTAVELVLLHAGADRSLEPIRKREFKPKEPQRHHQMLLDFTQGEERSDTSIAQRVAENRSDSPILDR